MKKEAVRCVVYLVPHPLIQFSMIFEESDLRFEFSPKHWQVKKYDTHRYFRILSGVGLKGVDFVGILNGQSIVFFEVKNYRTHHPTKSPSYLIFEDTEAFLFKIIKKLKDTLRAIQIIQQYLERKWWFRLYTRWQAFIPERLISRRDWYFWFQIYKKSQKWENTILVLWLEIDHHYSPISKKKLKARLEIILEKELSQLVGKVEIASLEKPIFPEQLIVT